MAKKKKTLFYVLGTAIPVLFMIFCINLMVHADGIVVTPETFEDYYSVNAENKTATLKEEQANEITFRGDFSDVLAGKVNRIVVDRTNVYTGQNAVFKDVYFEVSADNVSISGFSFNNTGVGYCVKVFNCSGLDFSGNSLTMKTDTENDGYGIYAESSGNISIKDNNVIFEGNTEGTASNYAVFISGNPTDSGIEVSDNTFDISLASCFVPWVEEPAGSGNWVSRPISGGLLFDSCHNLTVSKNTVNITYNNVVGSYDTIYGIDIRGDKRPEGEDTPDIYVTENKLTLNGNSYAYGLNIEQDGFEVKGNEFSVNANYYANGINLGENCFNGLVEQNSITAGVSEDGYFSIGLYAYVHDAEGITFRKNTIQLSGKIGYGIQWNAAVRSGNKLHIEENIINGDGGCMAGIAIAGGGSYEIKENSITVSGNATEKYSAWDSFYIELPKTYGIAIIDEDHAKSAEIGNNKIQSSDLGIVSWTASVISGNEIQVQGEYTIDVYRDEKEESNASKVFDNCLTAANRKGDSSVYGTNVDEVYNNIGKSISVTVTFKVVNGSWNDGTGDAATADRIVTLTGYEGDTLKLATDQIPAAGNKPDDTYKEGSWDVVPSTETEITESTTYTYTYAKKETAVIKTAPAAKELTYNGQGQELVTAGTAEAGIMYYALGTDATTKPSDELYTTSIPTATEAGTYYVWYYVKGDTDSDAYCVVITIEKRDISADATVKQAEGRSLSYNGAAQKPDITVSVNGVILIEGSDYTVTYAGVAPTVYEESADAPVYAGSYKMIISYKGNYSGTSVMDFSIDPARYTISFNANGGRGTMADQVIVISGPADKAVLNANAFKHYELKFAGWNTASDGSGVAYEDAAELTPTADMVLYAQWSNAGDVWNLFEDDSEHIYVLYDVYAEGTIANSNAKSSMYYDATMTGNKISVKLKAGAQRKTAAGAANSVLEFKQADGSVVTYTLPVSYVKPQLKLSANTYTIKAGADSIAETTILIRKAGGNYEPIAFGTGDVVTYNGNAVTISADGKVSVSVSGRASGKLMIKKAGWESAVSLSFTIKVNKKDVISVGLGGVKTVTINANAAGQKFSYPVYINGKRATEADGITLTDASGMASYSDGILTIAYKNGVKGGTRKVILKKGIVSAVVKVKVSTMTLDKSVVLAAQSKYDVVTGQSMVLVPKFKGIDGRITKVELNSVGKCDKNDFYAEVNAAGNIVVSYDGNALNAKNLVIGDMGFKITVTDTEGADTVIDTVVRNVRAKKSMPKVTAVKISASKDANGDTLGVVNIVSTYKDAKGATHIIAPVSAKIIGLTNVEAKVNANDPSQIDISNTKGIKGNGNVRVELTYPGGVTKKITIRINKIAK